MPRRSRSRPSSPTPPVAQAARLAYVYTPPRDFPEHCFTYNDFGYVDHTSDARLPGAGFVAFSSVADATAALYLGFDKPFPSDLISLYVNIQEVDGVTGPALTWEYWDGGSWDELAVQDETEQLVQPGMIEFVGPSDAAALARFGTPLYWVRGRLREDGDPVPTTILSIDPNAVWATQTQTINNEVLGSGDGQPGQSFFAARPPVLGGEVLQVRELERRAGGDRAADPGPPGRLDRPERRDRLPGADPRGLGHLARAAEPRPLGAGRPPLRRRAHGGSIPLRRRDPRPDAPYRPGQRGLAAVSDRRRRGGQRRRGDDHAAPGRTAVRQRRD